MVVHYLYAQPLCVMAESEKKNNPLQSGLFKNEPTQKKPPLATA